MINKRWRSFRVFLRVAWQHVNLFGTFEFSPAESTVDLDALAAYYIDPMYWSKVLQEEQEAHVS